MTMTDSQEKSMLAILFRVAWVMCSSGRLRHSLTYTIASPVMPWDMGSFAVYSGR